MSDITPSDHATDRLKRRCERMVKYLTHLENGEHVPLKVLDDEVHLVREACDRWDSERKAGGN